VRATSVNAAVAVVAACQQAVTGVQMSADRPSEWLCPNMLCRVFAVLLQCGCCKPSKALAAEDRGCPDTGWQAVSR
jgi:hypothetical protein